ncbi:hypothetical protein OEZ85_010827 [Tetradesmus obliquus]|uniref:Uncharacterized protein n=1 Tax=Tetradesmus obliquus TaxID=3088 RepID=A0ABY8TNR8_TETOB|nr:hypothetical protein OEZ85_010827 [Tetradesmus obliquus]
MEFTTFLATQAWLQPTPVPEQDQQASSKRPKLTRLSCRASFHISLQEQQGTPEQWLGAKARDAVFIRLQRSGGLITSVADVKVAVLQQHGAEGSGGGPHSSTLVVIEWSGSGSTTISSEHVTKVVCSAAIHAKAMQQQQQQQQQPCLQPGSCLLAAGPAQDTAAAAAAAAPAGNSKLEYITLVTPHVCLNFFAQHREEAVEALARIAACLHQQAGSSAGAAASLQASAAVPASTCSRLQAPAVATLPAGGAQMAQWLAGAACEANMMQLLLAQPAGEAAQQQHMLQALGHLHASLKR